jgi:hypothetical protein
LRVKAPAREFPPTLPRKKCRKENVPGLIVERLRNALSKEMELAKTVVSMAKILDKVRAQAVLLGFIPIVGRLEISADEPVLS